MASDLAPASYPLRREGPIPLRDLDILAGRLRDTSHMDRAAGTRICLEVATQLEALAERISASPSEDDRIEQIRKTFDLDGRGASALLVKLLDAPDHVHTHASLVAALGYGHNSLKVFMSRLRRALESRGFAPDAIESIWGVGYRLSHESARRLHGLAGFAAQSDRSD